MTTINSPAGLLESFQNQLEHDWSRFRNIAGNDTARGSSYENALSNLLDQYLGGKFDIHTACSVMDRNVSCFDKFGNGASNEIDVVALFSHSTPRIVLREHEITWVPLSGVAFLCEVKSRVDKGRLESDLDKLSVLRELEKDPDDRFGVTVSGDYSVNHQLHCLVYDESSISDDELNSQLANSTDWDLVLLVKEGTLMINNTLSISEYLVPLAIASQIPDPSNDERISNSDEPQDIHIPGNSEDGIISINNGLTWFILAISGSIPWPVGLTTADHLSQLAMKSETKLQFGAAKSVSEQINLDGSDENSS
ncbi:hypothetical protein SY89_00686 [Halolamina pelagica]|uniref:DUF6602 domain-containing protein n=1 Tax=Halolamina pelagica TaxID=699431 RepID=A0A0P7H8X8_9EURY|nr:DUF6602 domain-containing protein [Halolamina pelagica]KPN29966.1 hypothetical protein SY89_00686 [Halolamina pelagica]